MSNLIPLFIIIPLGVAFLTPVFGKHVPWFHKVLLPASLFFLFLLGGWFLLHNGMNGSIIYKVGGWEPVAGVPIGIHLVLDGFSELMLIIINLMGCLVAIYSIGYLKKYTGEIYYYTLLSLMVAGMNGVVATGDLFNLFVFLEISVIASFALVAFGTGMEELEASFKYQVLGGIASLLILLGIGLIYWYTRSLNMDDISMYFRSHGQNKVLMFIEAIMLSGFGLKAAMVPFHSWLPDAHSSAPSPISAMLSGVFIKAIGVYALIRLFFAMFPLYLPLAIAITVIGVCSMVAGVFLAIGQWNLKRLLAYHSISQMGYVVMAAGIGMMLLASHGDIATAELCIAGGLFHLINHAAFKGLLFLNAGALEHSLNTRNLKEMGGVAFQMPVTSATSFSASLAISGIPPFNGFFSKLLIIVAAIRAGYLGLAIVAALVSILTLASFMKFQRYAFGGKQHGVIETAREVPFSMCLPMVILAVCCLLLSLLILPVFRNIVITPAVEAITHIAQAQALIH